MDLFRGFIQDETHYALKREGRVPDQVDALGYGRMRNIVVKAFALRALGFFERTEGDVRATPEIGNLFCNLKEWIELAQHS